MIREGHPALAHDNVHALKWLAAAERDLTGVQGFGPPSWPVLVGGARQPNVNLVAHGVAGSNKLLLVCIPAPRGKPDLSHGK